MPPVQTHVVGNVDVVIAAERFTAEAVRARVADRQIRPGRRWRIVWKHLRRVWRQEGLTEVARQVVDDRPASFAVPITRDLLGLRRLTQMAGSSASGVAGASS